MNEIYKGMDNAAEKINENFEELADYVIEQGENYTKWASGKLEQWGTAAITKDEKSITLPNPFLDTKYQVFAQLNSVQDYDRSVAVQKSSDSTFIVHIYNAPLSISVNWHAIGRWK